MATSGGNRNQFFLAMFVALLYYVQQIQAGIHHLSIKDDTRALIVLEQFGYTRSGKLELEVRDVEWSTAGGQALQGEDLNSMGFLQRKMIGSK